MMLPFAGDPSRRTALATSPETERRCGVHKFVRRVEVPVCSGIVFTAPHTAAAIRSSAAPRPLPRSRTEVAAEEGSRR